MSTASVRPPFSLYRLETEAGIRNSPPEPAVYLTEVDEVSGAPLRMHTLTPEQARELAGGLNAAADEPEPDDPGRDGGDDLAAAHAIVAEGLAYTRDHFSVRPGQFVGQIPVVEYEAALDVVVAGVGDLIAERDRLAAELAAHTRCRHHDGTCSQIVDDNERLGAEVVRLRAALRAAARSVTASSETVRAAREALRAEPGREDAEAPAPAGDPRCESCGRAGTRGFQTFPANVALGVPSITVCSSRDACRRRGEARRPAEDLEREW